MPAVLEGQAAFVLTHLFAAELLDGTRIEQTPADVSAVDPSRSRFFDLCVKQEDGQVAQDSLGRAVTRDDIAFFGIVDTRVPHGPMFMVDLRDGHFEINGQVFRAEPVASNTIPAGGKYRLLYFRDHQQDVILEVGEHGDTQRFGDHRIAYRFGWEYTVGERRWEQTIVVE